jgi:hypothetical protein
MEGREGGREEKTKERWDIVRVVGHSIMIKSSIAKLDKAEQLETWVSNKVL